LKPKYIPAIPPTALRRIEEKESTDAPHNIGMYAPTVDPIPMPIHINDFEDIYVFLYFAGFM
jgi:hypothetical protein